MEHVENGPQNGSPDAVIFWSSGLFFLCQTALGAQMAPKPPPRAPKTSPSIDFHRFRIDFGWFFDDFLYHVGYFLSGLLHHFFGYLEVSFSNFWPQVQMCWGRTQGSARWQKSAKTSKASLRKRFSRHGGGTAGGNWDNIFEDDYIFFLYFLKYFGDNWEGYGSRFWPNFRSSRNHPKSIGIWPGTLISHFGII